MTCQHVLSSTFDVSLGYLLRFCAPSPYAGSPTGGSQVPPSLKPSAEGTTVCLSSDPVQYYAGYFWSFGTIRRWDASNFYVDDGYYVVKVNLANIRQYRSAKQCSSIQPGTESFPHSHLTNSPLARIKGSLIQGLGCRFDRVASLSLCVFIICTAMILQGYSHPHVSEGCLLINGPMLVTFAFAVFMLVI
jgi:hypothetical protein